MEYSAQEILSGGLVPVLLGFSRETQRTAHRMFRQYGILSHVFCDKISRSMRLLSLSMKFHTVPHTSGEQLMMTALEDFAKQTENADVVLYLIPCTEEYVNFVWLHREQLERRYVIADKKERCRAWTSTPAPRIKE